MTHDRTELLFSDGTLRLTPVQMATFSRTLAGHPDRLPGYTLTMLEIRDARSCARAD
jgi:hypothetical protein